VLHGMTTDDPSYVMAVDKSSGKTIWRVERPTDAPSESPDNYATPILVEVDGKLQLIVSGGDYVTGHALDTGKELWRLGGFNPTNDRNYRTIASSVALDDLVFTTSRQGRPFIGFKPGGSGDVTGKVELWRNDLGTDVPTPTTDGERLFVVNDRGILTVLDPKTGEPVGERKRLEPGTYSASPLLADGKIYATSEDGATTVVQADESLEILAVNKLDEYTLASPVAVGNQLFIRTMDYVYCIEE
jgi:outer membrane protein assembly factor BamB